MLHQLAAEGLTAQSKSGGRVSCYADCVLSCIRYVEGCMS